ncbi:MAG: hypothetical protein JWM41_1804 [Gemmatimonadetes bacterium]|nr:hypothetical protein [Gemmatimonadota bacterium]
MQRQFSPNAILWSLVAAIRRRPWWQRELLHAVWIVGVVGSVWLWIWSFDCPMC